MKLESNIVDKISVLPPLGTFIGSYYIVKELPKAINALALVTFTHIAVTYYKKKTQRKACTKRNSIKSIYTSFKDLHPQNRTRYS